MNTWYYASFQVFTCPNVTLMVTTTTPSVMSPLVCVGVSISMELNYPTLEQEENPIVVSIKIPFV